MANEQALIQELKKPEYQDLSDQAAADRVNARTVTQRQPVESGTLQDACMSLGIWASLAGAAETGAVDPPANLARTMIERLRANRPLDLDNDAVKSMVQQAIGHDLMTEQQAAQMDALGDVSVPWTEANNVGTVGIGLVINARNQIAGGA